MWVNTYQTGKRGHQTHRYVHNMHSGYQTDRWVKRKIVRKKGGRTGDQTDVQLVRLQKYWYWFPLFDPPCKPHQRLSQSQRGQKQKRNICLAFFSSFTFVGLPFLLPKNFLNSSMTTLGMSLHQPISGFFCQDIHVFKERENTVVPIYWCSKSF